MSKSKAKSQPNVPTRLLRLFFRLLYHPFAWAYDLVADTVSLGRWKGWVTAVTTLTRGERVLELGFGPGHLQAHLKRVGSQTYGLDESMQMNRQARRRLLRQGFSPILARGLAQALPFPNAAFDTVVATFPTLYIVDPLTLAEVQRVLAPGGRLVVLMSAWITGRSLAERVLQKLFSITAQVPPDEVELSSFLEPYQQAGFQASLRFMEPPGSRLMFMIAQKQPTPPAHR
jgi:ubiquinone/menaquinone biosynthesis C-methylase UbiE